MKKQKHSKEQPKRYYAGGIGGGEGDGRGSGEGSGGGDSGSSGHGGGDGGHGMDGGFDAGASIGSGGGGVSYANPDLSQVTNLPNMSNTYGAGYSRAELEQMAAMGLSNQAISDTQTVAMGLASAKTNDALNAFGGFMQSMLSPVGIATLAGGPVAGALVSGIQALGSGASFGQVAGQVASGFVSSALSRALGFNVPATAVNAAISGQYGQAAMTVGINAAAQAMGVSPSVVASMAQGQFGQAAANMALGAITGEIASNLGTNPAFVGAVLNATGLSQTVGTNIKGLVDSMAPELGKQVSQMYGSIVGLKGEGLGLSQFGALGKSAAQAGALSQPSTGGDGPGTGIAAPGFGAAAADKPSTSGLAALAAAYGAQKGAKAMQDKQASEAQQKQAESSRKPAQLFSDQIFAGGGMVQRFAEGGEPFDWSQMGGTQPGGMTDAEVEDYLYSIPGGYDDYPLTDAEVEDYLNSIPGGHGEYSEDSDMSGFDTGALTKIWSGLTDAAKSLFLKKDGGLDFSKLAAIAGGIYGYNSQKGQDLSTIGFQGQIPQTAATRAQVPYQYDAERRPGSAGRRYMSDMHYAKPEGIGDAQSKALVQAGGLAGLQRSDGTMRTAIAPGGIKPLAPEAPQPDWLYKSLTSDSSAQDVARAYNQYIGTTGQMGDTEANRTDALTYLRNLGMGDDAISTAYQTYLNKQFAAGGIASLSQGGPAREPRYLDGPTNGQTDEIETTIDGEQPALLSHGEFVIPADVVGALGGGNSKAGAEALYSMMDRVRQQAFGRKEQMDQVDPNKVLPA